MPTPTAPPPRYRVADMCAGTGAFSHALAIDRISSASPQLGAAKRGQEAGIAPGRSPPAQPRLPPGAKGLPEGAKPEPANGTPETQTQRNRQELKIRHGRPSVSLVFQLLCRLQESSPVHKLFAGVSVRTFGIALTKCGS